MARKRVTIVYQAPVYKQSKVLRYWAKRHFVLLSNGRLFQAPGPIALSTEVTPRERARRRGAGPAAATGSLPNGKHADSDDSDADTDAAPIVATLVGGGRSGLASCSCTSAGPVCVLPDSDYDPRVKFLVTAGSFVGVLGEDDRRPLLKLSNEQDLLFRFDSRAALEKWRKAITRVRSRRADELALALGDRRGGRAGTAGAGDGAGARAGGGVDDGDGDAGSVYGRPRSMSDGGGVRADHTALPASTLQRMVLVVNRYPDDVAVGNTPTPAPEVTMRSICSTCSLTCICSLALAWCALPSTWFSHVSICLCLFMQCPPHRSTPRPSVSPNASRRCRAPVLSQSRTSLLSLVTLCVACP
jgi:hypothetical protein